VPPGSSDAQWYTVRCIFRWASAEESSYEERLTLWQADNLDAAIALAEGEATQYAQATDVEYLGLAQAYSLSGTPGSGTEVYSLIRESDLSPDDYLDQFFDTGRERQSHWDEP
jgi:hypothetical protein